MVKKGSKKGSKKWSKTGFLAIVRHGSLNEAHYALTSGEDDILGPFFGHFLDPFLTPSLPVFALF